MKLYLVAQARFKQLCKSILRGGLQSLQTDMKLLLAESGGIWEAYFDQKQFANAYILQSFFYADDFTEQYIIPNASDFLLDSGAFTFCANGVSNHDFIEYVERYADFINRNRIDKFFELDIENIIGYDKVVQIRKQLERLTNRQPIPVWHICRGKDEFIRHCDEYPYVALGGYVTAIKNGDSRQRAYVKAYPWFIDQAHKRGTKIHGLGFTSLEGMKKYHFDSVDSTAWTTGNRFGFVYRFNGKTMEKIDCPKGKRLADAKTVAYINYTEWIKFQKYANTHF